MARERPRTAVNFYLDHVAKDHNVADDRELAKLLELTPQAVSKMRLGGSMSVKTAVKVAELLDHDSPMGVIAATQQEAEGRGMTHETIWKKYLSVANSVLVATALGAGIAGAPAPTQAAPLAGQSAPMCIMSNRRKRLAERTRTAASAFAELVRTLTPKLTLLSL